MGTAAGRAKRINLPLAAKEKLEIGLGFCWAAKNNGSASVRQRQQRFRPSGVLEWKKCVSVQEGSENLPPDDADLK